MKLLGLAVVSALVFAVTAHGVALVATFVALGFFLRWACTEGADDDRLALGAHRYPGGDR